MIKLLWLWLAAVFPFLLGSGSYYFVAPQAEMLGLLFADPLTLIICIPVGIVYAVVIFECSRRDRLRKSLLSVMAFVLGIAVVLVFYPAYERYAYPSEPLVETASDYVKRCDMDSVPEDKITVGQRPRLYFDYLRDREWRISVYTPYYQKNRESYRFSVKESMLKSGECVKMRVE